MLYGRKLKGFQDQADLRGIANQASRLGRLPAAPQQPGQYIAARNRGIGLGYSQMADARGMQDRAYSRRLQEASLGLRAQDQAFRQQMIMEDRARDQHRQITEAAARSAVQGKSSGQATPPAASQVGGMSDSRQQALGGLFQGLHPTDRAQQQAMFAQANPTYGMAPNEMFDYDQRYRDRNFEMANRQQDLEDRRISRGLRLDEAGYSPYYRGQGQEQGQRQMMQGAGAGAISSRRNPIGYFGRPGNVREVDLGTYGRGDEQYTDQENYVPTRRLADMAAETQGTSSYQDIQIRPDTQALRQQKVDAGDEDLLKARQSREQAARTEPMQMFQAGMTPESAADYTGQKGFGEAEFRPGAGNQLQSPFMSMNEKGQYIVSDKGQIIIGAAYDAGLIDTGPLSNTDGTIVEESADEFDARRNAEEQKFVQRATYIAHKLGTDDPAKILEAMQTQEPKAAPQAEAAVPPETEKQQKRKGPQRRLNDHSRYLGITGRQGKPTTNAQPAPKDEAIPDNYSGEEVIVVGPDGQRYFESARPQNTQSSAPPMQGARWGKDPNGQWGWYVQDERGGWLRVMPR